VAHNKYSDWTRQEYQKLLGYKSKDELQNDMIATDHPKRNLISFDPVPLSLSSTGTYGNSIDWVSKGHVTN
jgi:hypothetical protein